MFQMSDEKRRIAQKQARPFGLRGKCRHAALRDLARAPPFPASRATHMDVVNAASPPGAGAALPGDIWRSNADCVETATDPSYD